MKNTVLSLFGILVMTVSCSSANESIQKDAESLCNCYSQIFAADPENVEEVTLMEERTKSCNQLWKEIYDKYKDNETQRKAFNQAYNVCQDEK